MDNGHPSSVVQMYSNKANGNNSSIEGSFTVKDGLAKMLKGGVIMDVVNAEQARIAEEAGACAVMVRILDILLKGSNGFFIHFEQLSIIILEAQIRIG